MSKNREIRVAIAGVGNCASSLVQGIEYYRDASPDDAVPGLMHVELGGYHVRDVTFVAAFDVDASKVGQDLGKAVFAHPNNTVKFAEVPELAVEERPHVRAHRADRDLRQRIGVPGPSHLRRDWRVLLLAHASRPAPH